uniref:Peroxisomal ATPase PEX1 n=1 Tax=Panagrellus redivivus TaxID=6233 RepID=A0A7E4VS65_PANRE
MTFVVKIIENPSQLNCFGYLLRTPTTTPSSHAFGVFHCTQIHANNPATFVIQVFGEQSPFSFIQFHPIFAHVLGVAAGDELVLEPVSQIPTCTSMEIYPETYEDWNVIETTAVVIEDLFLDQIRIVSTGMQFVLFVAQNVAVKFRVLSTTPADAPEGAVIASNMTEVLVAPRVQSKKTPIHGSINSQSGPPRSFADKIGDSAKSTILNQFTCPEERSRVLRILSTDLVDFDFQHLKFGNQNYIIALNEERSSMIRKSLVNIGKPSNQFLFLIELPQSSCNEYIQEVINLLQKYPGHCITSSPELHQFIECTTIKINYLTPSDVTVVRELYVSDESALDIDGDASDIDLKAIRNVLYQNFNSDDVYLPVIVPEDGIFVDLPVDGTTKSFRLESRHSHDNCNIFWPDSMPNITAVYPNDDTVASKRPKPSENVESAVSFTNFGTLNFSKSALRNQVDQIVAVYNEITTSSESKLEYRALITGHHGSGRSTLLKLIANHSFLENCVFSVYINCNGWKSKSVETVQKQLSDALKFVQKRKPSILFLDNIDFLNVNLDDEDRSKFVAKVYYYIAKALFSTPDVSIVATAKSIHDLPPALLAVDSKRLFDSVFEVVSLNQF